MASRDDEIVGLKKKIGENVLNVRRAKKWSLEDAWAMTGVPRETIWRIENAKMTPSLHILARMAAGYEVRVESFLEGMPLPEPSSRDMAVSA